MITTRLEKNVTAGTVFKYEETEGKLVKLVLVGNVEDGATVDCRKCVLEIQGDIGNNVTTHSLGAAPLITGKKGRDVTFHKYNKLGECLGASKIGVPGTLDVRGNSRVTISTSLVPQPAVSLDLLRALSASAQSTSGPLSASHESPTESSTAPLSSKPTEEHKSLTISLVGVGGNINAAPGSNVRISMSAGASSHMFAFPGAAHGAQADSSSPMQSQKLRK